MTEPQPKTPETLLAPPLFRGGSVEWEMELGEKEFLALMGFFRAELAEWTYDRDEVPRWENEGGAL